jgi:crossover junction endodeoxyribonuclease RuvC
MVTRILKLDERPTPADAADALALAICHVWRGGMTGRLQEAAGSRANLEALAKAQSRLQVARLKAAVAAQEGRR